MAATDIQFQSSSIVHTLTAPLRGLWNAMVFIAESNAKVREIEALQAMSDAQLAEIGIAREDIVHHVLRDLMHL